MAPKKKKKSTSEGGPPVIFNDDSEANHGRLTLLDGARTERLTSSVYINALLAQHEEPEPTEASMEDIANLEKELELLEARSREAIPSIEESAARLQEEEFLPADLLDHIEQTVNALNGVQDSLDGRFSKLQNHCDGVQRELRQAQFQHHQPAEALQKANSEYADHLVKDKQDFDAKIQAERTACNQKISSKLVEHNTNLQNKESAAVAACNKLREDLNS